MSIVEEHMAGPLQAKTKGKGLGLPLARRLAQLLGGDIELERREQPSVIFLDFLLTSGTAFDVLDDLRASPATQSIPVIISTSHALDAAEKERLFRDTMEIINKDNLSRELAINRIRDALQRGKRESDVS